MSINKKVVPTNELKPGMVAADDIYTFAGQLIIQKGTPLTERIITRLKFYSVTGISIENAPLTYREQIMQTPEFQQFRADYTEATKRLSGILDHVADKTIPPEPSVLLEPVFTVTTQVRNSRHLFDILHCMRDSDDMTYVHSLNVALISVALADWLNVPKKDIPVLMTAALLHDIGKLMIPKDILEQPRTLTEQEYAVVRTHTQLGYNLIQDMELDNRIKNAVLMHHERCDGSGYPVGFTGGQLDSFTKIIAIADVYDAMSSKRTYRNKICPFAIVRQFEEEGLQKFDPQYILTFLHSIVETFLHNNVLLSDGSEGKVVMINQNDLSRPVVELNESDIFIDLARRRDLYIESVL